MLLLSFADISVNAIGMNTIAIYKFVFPITDFLGQIDFNNFFLFRFF